jgi:hypothetical protein
VSRATAPPTLCRMQQEHTIMITFDSKHVNAQYNNQNLKAIIKYEKFVFTTLYIL